MEQNTQQKSVFIIVTVFHTDEHHRGMQVKIFSGPNLVGQYTGGYSEEVDELQNVKLAIEKTFETLPPKLKEKGFTITSRDAKPGPTSRITYHLNNHRGGDLFF